MKGNHALRRFCVKSLRSIKCNSSTILTFVGVAGVIGTAVLASTETPKALQRLAIAKEEKGEALTKLEMVTTAAPAYIPAVAVGAGTILCIFGANTLNRKQQASLVSAYGLLDQAYKEYKSKVKEMFGPETDEKVQESIARDKYREDPIPLSPDKCVFYEEHIGRYFERTMAEILDAEMRTNESLIKNGVTTLNEFFELLGLEEIDGGDLIGWEVDSCEEFYGSPWVDFEHRIFTLDDGLEGYIIDMSIKPYFIL